MGPKKFSRSEKPRLNTGNHGKFFKNKIEEIITSLQGLNVIAFKEDLNLKGAGTINLDFVSGKDATNTIPQFVLIEKANDVDVYDAGIPGVAPYLDITITGGLVAGQVIDFQGMNNGQIIAPSGYTIPVAPTISGVVAAIVAAANNGQYVVTQINSSTFRITSSQAGMANEGEGIMQAGNSTATFAYSNVSEALEGGVDAILSDMEVELDGEVIAQGVIIGTGASLVYNSRKGYGTNSGSVVPCEQSSAYSVVKTVACNDDFYVNIYVCGLNL